MSLFALVFLKDMEPCSFLQFELVGIVRSARANQALASGRTSDVLNVRPIAVSQPEILQQILHVAIWAFNVQTSFKHAD